MLYNITDKALKSYEKVHDKALKDHTKELPRRRLTAHIKACELTGKYRDISPTRTVYCAGNMKIVVDGDTIEDIFFTKTHSLIDKKQRDYIKQFSLEFGISGRGRSFIRNNT
jgi:hypothetical protein